MNAIVKMIFKMVVFNSSQREKACCQHGCLKNFSPALCRLLIKVSAIPTFSKAHVSKTHVLITQLNVISKEMI
jgi:hypothetical protein